MPTDLADLSNWLEIKKESFENILLKHKNKNHFDDINSIESSYINILKNIDVSEYSEYKLINSDNNIDYLLTDNREYINEKQMIMIGRDYADKYNYGAIIDTPIGAGKLI